MVCQCWGNFCSVKIKKNRFKIFTNNILLNEDIDNVIDDLLMTNDEATKFEEKISLAGSKINAQKETIKISNRFFVKKN